jgi:hypothetical protein
MEFMPHGEVSTDGWTAKVHQYPFPDHSSAPGTFLTRGRKWPQVPSDRPWFDQAGASERVEDLRRQGLVTRDEERLMLQFIHDGYFVIERAIDESQFDLLDAYNRGLDDVWTTDQVLDGLQVSGLRVDGTRRNPIAHAELISWPLEKRIHLRDTETWRIHYYQPYTKPGLEIAKARRLVRMAELLLQRNPVLLNLTTYKYSSEVALHQDMWFYHLHPANHLVGVWLACEDVTPDTGPLAVYPGSHKLPMWPGFANYPQTNYRTCLPSTHDEIEAYLRSGVEDTSRVVLPVKKGDAIFLNGLLVHDADKVRKRGQHSRFSIVLHYTVAGANKADEVEGPFNY